MFPIIAKIAIAAVAANSAGIGLAIAADPAPMPSYQVEIVVFRALQPLGVAEDWKAQITQEEAESEEGMLDAAPPDAAQEHAAVRPLSSTHFKLAGTDAALRRSANYQVLAHAAWLQTVTPRGRGSGASLAQIGIGDQTLGGRVVLEQGRYLHLNFDVAWTPADPPTSLLGARDDSSAVTFSLRQKRRIRLSETHYFDHPAFGIIALVSPAN